MNCPVCNLPLSQQLPPFCPQCAWDLKNDLTLNAFLSPIPEKDFANYRKKLNLAKQNWQYLQGKKKNSAPSGPGKNQPQQGKQAGNSTKGFFKKAIASFHSFLSESDTDIPFNKQKADTTQQKVPNITNKQAISKKQTGENGKESHGSAQTGSVKSSKTKKPKQQKIPRQSIKQPVFERKADIEGKRGQQ